MATSKANLLCKRKPEGDVETEPVLKKPKEVSEEEKETTKEQIKGRVELLKTKSDESNLISVKDTDETPDFVEEAAETVEGLNVTPDFVEDSALSKKTLFVSHLPPHTGILDIINFFGDVAEVVSVRLIVNHRSKHVGCGFVEFASPYEANKALEYKNGEYLHDHKIFLMKGPDETPDSAEAVATVRNKTLFVSHLCRRTKMSDIIHFFKDVGQVVHVRQIVDPYIRHVGFAFVEFASANEAAKALEKSGEYLNYRKIFVNVVKSAPYPKHCIDHKVWYEDYPQRESLRLDETQDIVEKKTVFFASLSMKKDNLCSTSKIIQWFSSIGKSVRVRMIGDDRGELLGCGFVEFASANEAKKAVKEKNGSVSYVKVAETDPFPFRPKYKLPDLVEKLWYEDNLRGEGFGLPNQSRSVPVNQQASFCGKKITLED